MAACGHNVRVEVARKGFNNLYFLISFLYEEHEINRMGFAYRSGWRIFWTRGTGNEPKTSLDRMVRKFRYHRCCLGYATSVSDRFDRCYFGSSHFDKAGTFGVALDDILGFLYGNFEADSWRIIFRFYRAICQLGCAFGLTALGWLATIVEGTIQIDSRFIRGETFLGNRDFIFE